MANGKATPRLRRHWPQRIVDPRRGAGTFLSLGDGLGRRRPGPPIRSIAVAIALKQPPRTVLVDIGAALARLEEWLSAGESACEVVTKAPGRVEFPLLEAWRPWQLPQRHCSRFIGRVVLALLLLLLLLPLLLPDGKARTRAEL